MLARRELSEKQVRQRLARKQFEQDEIDDAIEKLLGERAIDDARVAEAIARTETSFRKRGKLRVKRKIESAGVSSAAAKRAVDEIFSTIDSASLLESALAKRLRGGQTISGDREFNRLYRYLVGQGFEPDRVLELLRSRKCST
jgi:regulatory protein